MPTSFAAFTFREGYPRRIPDDGKYYHLGQKVNTLVTRAKPNEHPEINKPTPKPRKLKGEVQEINDMAELASKGELVDLSGNSVEPAKVPEMLDNGRVLRKGTARNIKS
jgi:hypothetical protein